MLKIALIQKLEDSTLPFSTSVALSRFVLERRVNLGLSLNDRLIQLASFFKYVNDFPQWKRPLEVFDKLEALAIEPFVFQSKAFDVDGSTFVIPLESLIKLYKSANVKREDLPTMVTPEAYEQFCQQLHYKVEFNPDDSDLALEDLQTTWNTISNPIFNDPTDYLAILIGTSTGDVSEDETKWKAVLHSVFEKSNAAKEGCFFTEQEEAFIIIMRGIQGCTFGLSAGIAAAYQYSIEDEYHYSVDLPLPDSPEVIVEKKRKMEVLGKLSQPIRKKGCLSIIDLRKSVNQNRENKEMAYSLVSEENCWDYEEDDINMELNDEGAKALWKALQEERKKKCMTFVGQKIFSFLEQQIDGENLMKSLCDEIKKIDQGAHQWIYLKNLIGPIFGFVKNIRFDMHTGLLYDSLLKKTREEVLSIFFEYVTPQAVVNELIRAVNADLEENKDLLAPLLSDDYWNQQGLTVQGALALLLKSGLIRHG